MRRLSMHPVFAFWGWGVVGWGGGGAIFFVFFPCSQSVLNMFPWDSPSSLKLFPKLFTLYPIQFAQSSTLTYINWKVHNRFLGDTFAPTLKLGSEEVVPFGSCSMLQKDWWWVNENMALSKKTQQKQKQSYECTHELIINMRLKLPWWETYHLIWQIWDLLEISSISEKKSWLACMMEWAITQKDIY